MVVFINAEHFHDKFVIVRLLFDHHVGIVIYLSEALVKIYGLRVVIDDDQSATDYDNNLSVIGVIHQRSVSNVVMQRKPNRRPFHWSQFCTRLRIISSMAAL